jgi:hypothetical protein
VGGPKFKPQYWHTQKKKRKEKKKKKAMLGTKRLTPIVLATWEADLDRIMV